jgi:hypothetical protein
MDTQLAAGEWYNISMNGMINPNTIDNPGLPELNKPTSSVETGNEVMPVAAPALAEQPAAPATFVPVNMPTADVAAAVVALSPSDQSLASAPTVQLPSVADSDKIEPEWVAATEKAVKRTAGNPFAEEEAIEDIQIDYQKKRFNRDLKKSTND